MSAFLARCMGKKDLAAEILQKFENQAAASIDKLQSHLRASEAEQFARVSHTLKGTASLMSADAVTKLASDLEQAAIKRDFTLMTQQLASLTEEVQRCARFISNTSVEATVAPPTGAAASRERNSA
jgi:HPt (histidine-containing phosphotransfer) domain-containing protein